MAELHQPLISHLQELLDRTVRDDPAVHGGILLIDTPDFQWKSASGVIHPGVSTAILPDDQFAAASITQMMTATGCMLLVEEGGLELDMKISRYLPGQFFRVFIPSRNRRLIRKSLFGSC